jgi:hypothetical protein
MNCEGGSGPAPGQRCYAYSLHLHGKLESDLSDISTHLSSYVIDVNETQAHPNQRLRYLHPWCRMKLWSIGSGFSESDHLVSSSAVHFVNEVVKGSDVWQKCVKSTQSEFEWPSDGLTSITEIMNEYFKIRNWIPRRFELARCFFWNCIFFITFSPVGFIYNTFSLSKLKSPLSKCKKLFLKTLLSLDYYRIRII